MEDDRRRNRLVGDVRSLSRTHGVAFGRAAQPRDEVSVTFADGSTARLDVADRRGAVWADVLKSLHETGRRAYVEVDPETELITELLLPLEFRVVGIDDTDDENVEVDLEISQARHHVKRSNPEFAELMDKLQTALRTEQYVLVTERLDSHEIIDVRLLGQAGDGSDQGPAQAGA